MNKKLKKFLSTVQKSDTFDVVAVYDNSFKVVGNSEKLKKVFWLWGFELSDFIGLKQSGETSMVFDRFGILDKKWSRIWK